MAKQRRLSAAPSTAVPPPTDPPTVEHTEDFSALYANHIRFEPTVYDLKLLFGESDVGQKPEVIRQHTAITIPWSLVKLAIYYLTVNLEFHELANGKVHVPPNQIPAPASPVPLEMVNDPNAVKAAEIVAIRRQEFVDNL